MQASISKQLTAINLYSPFGVPNSHFDSLLVLTTVAQSTVFNRIFENKENIGLMKELVTSMKEVEAETGRHVCPLRAGDQGLAECLVNGAEGNFNGGGSWRGREDVAIYKAVKRGDLNEAFAIQKRMEPATEAVRGRYGTKIRTYGRFPYRYKIACWLMGKIPNYYARLPRTAFSNEEVLMLRDALIKSELKVVREPKVCMDLGISEY